MGRQTVRRLILAGLALVLVGGALGSGAGAAVLCQKKNKFKIRAETCKGKETLVQDLGALGADVDALGPLPARLDQVAADANAVCAGAPTRTKATGGPLGTCGGGCRTFDGNQAGCNGAYVLAKRGATSCGYFDGLCLSCDECGARYGVCQNACAGPTFACADPTRTRFGGGAIPPFVDYQSYGTYGCYTFRTQGACEQGWHVSAMSGLPASCYWNGSSCYGCGPRNENPGACTNTCAGFSCKDAARPTRKRCREAADETECGQIWHVGHRDGGLVSSCYWDGPGNTCRGCGLRHEIKGLCANTCA